MKCSYLTDLTAFSHASMIIKLSKFHVILSLSLDYRALRYGSKGACQDFQGVERSHAPKHL